MTSSVYDFAIVGGGLSGCVLASRLREYNPAAKILLLEAGGETRDRPEVREPQALNLGGDLDWAYESEPVSQLGGRTVTLNAGKGLGGSSAINSCGWQRGAAADYDEWAALVGDDRYSYTGQLPYFRKSEKSFDEVNPEHHGKDGNIHVKTSGAANRIYPLSKQNAAAWEELGVTGVPNLDQNAGQNLGRAYLCEARREGKRQWAADAYALEGVEVRLNTLVAKIVLEKSDSGVRATGVELADGAFIAAKEVIVSAGAFRSPQLLLLSGIGLAEDLRQVGIAPVIDLPEVGQGLMDHVLFFQHWRVKDPLAGYTMGSPNELWAQPQYAQGMPFDWIVNTGVPEDDLKAAIKKDEGSEPDSTTHRLLKTPRTFLEYIVAYVKLPYPGTTMDAEHITTGVVSFLPTSRGSVSLKSSNPQDQPKIDMNYLSTEVDRFVYRQGLRTITKFMVGTQFSEHVSGETIPDILAAEPATLEDSDEKLNQRLAMASGTTWHACGSCAMGKVVDTAFRVHGVEGLRVVDASVFPVPLSAHIQAPLYALTEQAAAMIAGKA